MHINDMTEADAMLVVEGCMSGDVDEVDMLGIFRDPETWLNQSETYAARSIRGEG